MKVCFLGTPDFVQCIKEELAKHFILVDSLEEADLGVIAAYGKILSQEELDAPKLGCINVHPSLLPKYRGASPIQEAILHGDKTTGLTIIKMDAEVDHGAILYQQEITLAATETFESFAKVVFAEAAKVLPELIKDYLDGKIALQEQDHSKATFCAKLTRESGYFDLNTPPDPETLDRMIRAYYPWPGVWTVWEVKSDPLRLSEARKAKVKKIVKFLPEGKIQMEGKKAVPIKDFLNGYPDFPLTSF